MAFRYLLASIACSLLMFTGATQAQSDWLEPFPPHKVAGNLYYVGSKGLSSYLITTPQGHILINSSLEESVPLIKDSVEKLGFKFTDIKILLISHAHSDHCAGSAELIKQTGAQYMVLEQDAPAIEDGGGVLKTRLKPRDYTQFPPAKVDRVLKDGDTVTLGEITLTAHLTAGHTPGCTTWTLPVKDDASGKTLNAVIIGSPNVNPGVRLVDNPRYPRIASDYEKGFQVLYSLPVDLFLGAHGSYYGMEKKHAELMAETRKDDKAETKNPFIDPEGYHAYVKDREQAFKRELERQKNGQ